MTLVMYPCSLGLELLAYESLNLFIVIVVILLSVDSPAVDALAYLHHRPDSELPLHLLL